MGGGRFNARWQTNFYKNTATSVFRKGNDDKLRLIIDNSFGSEILNVQNS